MLAEILTQLEAHGIEALTAIVAGCITIILRKVGINNAAKHAEAFAPLVKEAINIGLRSTKNKIITNDTELAEAANALVKTMPVATQVLAPMQAKKLAVEALLSSKSSKENTKRIQSLGITADVDGRTIGAGIKAGFKRGDLSVKADSTGKAIAGFTFKF